MDKHIPTDTSTGTTEFPITMSRDKVSREGGIRELVGFAVRWRMRKGTPFTGWQLRKAVSPEMRTWLDFESHALFVVISPEASQ